MCLSFRKFSIVFSKNEVSIKLKKYISRNYFLIYFLSSVLTSIYGFSQASWLNLMTLRTFFKTNVWFKAFLEVPICITYSVLLCKLATSFSIFPIYILSGKNDKLLWMICKCSGCWISTSRKYLSSLSSL